LPRALCRELRSAKALPRALEALPRAWALGKAAGSGSAIVFLSYYFSVPYIFSRVFFFTLTFFLSMLNSFIFSVFFLIFLFRVFPVFFVPGFSYFSFSFPFMFLILAPARRKTPGRSG
jgi:hypothetical protein